MVLVENEQQLFGMVGSIDNAANNPNMTSMENRGAPLTLETTQSIFLFATILFTTFTVFYG